MNRKQLEELGLDEEQVNAVMKAYGQSINDIKDKAEQVDTLQSQIDDYKQQIKSRDEQLNTLQESAKGNEELQKEIEQLKKENSNTQKEWEQRLNEQKKESKLELALKDAGARNTKAVKANLNLDAVSLDGDNLIGLDEQLNGLKESDAYLFGEEAPKGLAGRDPVPGDDTGKKKELTKEQFNAMGYGERAKLYQEQPDLYRKLTE